MSRDSSRHALLLLGALQRRNPLDPVAGVQLSLRLRNLVDAALVVQHARLDDLQARERVAVAVQRGAALGAKVRVDRLAAVRRLGDLLERAVRRVALLGDDEVDGEGAARDLLAVVAVAQRLRGVRCASRSLARLRSVGCGALQRSRRRGRPRRTES